MTAAAQPPDRSLRRPRRGGGRLLFGVGAGLARRWTLPPSLVRAALTLTLLPLGAGVLLYGALTLVMPPDGAADTDANWRSELGRTLVQSLIVLAGVAASGVIVAVSVALAVFGLGAVVLLLATAALAALLVVDSAWATKLAGVVSLLLALPAAVVGLTDVHVARQFGVRVGDPTSPADVDPAGYRAGAGPLLIDLRDFQAGAGTTTTISGRADLRTLVVALPYGRCFDVVIDHRLETSWLDALLDRRRASTFIEGTPGYRPSRRSRRAVQNGASYSLLAFGNPVAGPTGRYVRTTGDPSAPKLHLLLASGRSQIIVRDYPNRIAPLNEPLWHPAQPRGRHEC